MRLTFSVALETCGVHRVSLADGLCFMCKTRTPAFTLPTNTTVCMICYRNVDGCCYACVVCPSCGSANRMPGVCGFCKIGVFNRGAVLITHKKFPDFFLRCLFNAERECIPLTSLVRSDARNLIPIILNYL